MGNKDVLWMRYDAFRNKVSLYEKTWHLHASKHKDDKIPATEEHVYQTIVDPDHARRSLDDTIGNESCVFQKDFAEGHFLVPVTYDGVVLPSDYEAGGKIGRVTTGYFRSGALPSTTVGEIFWTKPELVALAATSEEQAKATHKAAEKEVKPQ